MSGIHWVPLTTSSVTTKTRLQRAFKLLVVRGKGVVPI